MNLPKNKKKILLYILRLICKYYIAYHMFSYAFAKILKTQFSLGAVYNADSNISHFNGLMITWYYYGYSRNYALIIAACQIISGVFIIFRKTERIGVLLFLSFMVNIVLVNYFYEIGLGAMYMAIILTLMGFFLLLSDWRGFKVYFLQKTSERNQTFIPKITKKLYWIPFIIIPILLYASYDYIYELKQYYNKENELEGVWKAIPNSTEQKIFKLYFDKRENIKIKDFSRNRYQGDFELNDSLKYFKINVEHYTEVGAFIVADSLKKLNIPNDSLKSYQNKIIKYFSKKMNATITRGKYYYKINSDTLTIKDSLGLNQKFLNISKEYKGIE